MRLIGESQDYLWGGQQKSEYAPDEVVEVACPLCRSEHRKRLYTEHGAIGVSQCAGCSLVYTSPGLRSPEQVYWGDASLYYQEARLIFEGKASHHRDPNYLAEIETVERYKKAGRFLDVGCNMGMLLRLAMKRGWSCVGVEPSPWCMDIGWKAARTLFYRLSGLERLVRLGSLGYSAQNLVAVAKKR